MWTDFIPMILRAVSSTIKRIQIINTMQFLVQMCTVRAGFRLVQKTSASRGSSEKEGARTLFAIFCQFYTKNDKFCSKKGLLTSCTPSGSLTVHAHQQHKNQSRRKQCDGCVLFLI